MVLITQMAKIVYSYECDGWHEDDTLLFDDLSICHMIPVEDQLGLDQCVVTAHNLEHTTTTRNTPLKTYYISLHLIITGEWVVSH